MKSDVVRLFQTLEHRCGYYSERLAQNLVIDPLSPDMAAVYDHALERGFRRAGGHVYRPQCKTCHACVACRLPVDRFQPSRSQVRVAARNRDLHIEIDSARYTDEHFALYRRYIAARHAGGGMDDPDPDEFTQFLYANWSLTRFVEFRNRGELVAVAVTDFSARGLSAVYTFYAPEEQARSLGTYAILTQIGLTRAQMLPHLYLGYWISGHPKMDYKSRFQPMELLRGGKWTPARPDAA
jgi:arginyl-tRNA--protein-N-Asp/Glu arginylyltransferase